ncbi:TIGR02584 family CRISPR-associated protein [Rhodopseudomonas palustris]|uniref:TIGR02584 family CRISPR-associated protein n=1 Tax=Thiospirillum jenense TaxID=1653858 RepID=A0A839HDY7_9GAMM|nr:CRISPR-associated ring nuclease Csm6 [Thiospirillum jenense]MBB1093072.1 TIGR02584 family CRISPR-associated protein [Rhodopseudomonas palustris]MBB1127145.1 TIGR02584 family CRISPR-associated protein [Thiospirillum jenense]
MIAPLPHTYSRRILLAVTGLSPQILTETVYALAVMQQPAYIPTEIHLITTSEGANRARLSLLSDDPGWFHRLRRDYGLPEITFNLNNIHVLCDANGVELNDIRTPEDNIRMADLIAEQVRDLTADPASALHVSIAGGRKTMGYYVGYALSLFGRPQDRLSHVLVSEPFESSWDFFYPTPFSRVIEIRRPGATDPQLVDTAAAKITLAEIPFVRLRDGVPERLQQGHAGFEETIIAAQRAQQSPELSINLAQGCVIASGEPIKMPPKLLAFYSLMARRLLENQEDVRWADDDLHVVYLREHQLIGGSEDHHESVKNTLTKDGMTEEFFNECKSGVNKILRKSLGTALAKHYEIHGSGKRPKTRFGLTLDPDMVQFFNSDD